MTNHEKALEKVPHYDAHGRLKHYCTWEECPDLDENSMRAVVPSPLEGGDMSRAEQIERAANAVLAEYRADLRAAKWSDVLLTAVDALRAALSLPPGPQGEDDAFRVGFGFGWNGGATAMRAACVEHLRGMWDDGDQGNMNDAAELTLLGKTPLPPVPAAYRLP